MFRTARGARDGDHGLADAVDRRQDRLDLTELDPLAAQFDLEVAAPQILQLAGAVASDQVTGSVQPRSAARGIGDETLGGEVGAGCVPARELDTSQVQLAGDARGHGAQPLVEDERPGVPHRPPDRHHLGVGVRGRRGDLDCGFGRTEQVGHANMRERGAHRP